LRTAAAAAVAE
jgi:hypothetical protein